jgi:hypothetical protein
MGKGHQLSRLVLRATVVPCFKAGGASVLKPEIAQPRNVQIANFRSFVVSMNLPLSRSTFSPSAVPLSVQSWNLKLSLGMPGRDGTMGIAGFSWAGLRDDGIPDC